ncbi:MAG: site-2 protease family protein [Planctomycetota bacterium]
MGALLGLLQNVGEIALIVFGFGLVVFIHELGHFLAARWAGVRVLAFAVGFGPAIVSWRKGLGFRRGSSAAEYEKLSYDGPAEGVSPTEYRLNWLPLGGYVKMLGQDDADPSHRSEEPDSYNAAAIWKRMVIISAGVIANVVSAAALFVVVFSIGLKAPAAVIGTVAAGSPAAEAVPTVEGVTPGLLAGDRVVRIGGDVPRSFNDVMSAVLTSSPGRALPVVVERDGVGEVAFEVEPRRSSVGILEIGVGAAGSTTLIDVPGLGAMLGDLGLGPVGPGWRIAEVNGEPVSMLHDVLRAADAAGGEAVRLGFVGPSGATHDAVVETTPSLEAEIVELGDGRAVFNSLAGFVPVMTVGEAEEASPRSGRGYEMGLRTGDVFARLGGYEYPNVAQGMAAIRAAAGEDLPARVLRGGESVELVLSVRRDGTVGFLVDETSSLSDDEASMLVAAGPSGAGVRPGSRIVSLNGEAVSSFGELAQLLQGLARNSAESMTFDVGLVPPIGDDEVTRIVELDDAGVAALAGMGWDLPLALLAVETEETLLKSSGPVDAVALGLGETKRIMTMTYLTFVRLFQGSIAPRVLNGPVGIVHTGTTLFDRGFVWLLFFFALVSVNLAVINFLPIPITDGGHMVFLIWEGLTGKPVSVVVQNVATLAGLVLIVGMFLFVTYHDLARLLGS